MSAGTLSDIACANYFYLRTLCMNYCVIQHAKLPFVAYEEARHRNVTGFHAACIMQAFVHWSSDHEQTADSNCELGYNHDLARMTNACIMQVA